MPPVSLTISVNSSTPTTVTLTSIAGLRLPVKAGTVVGTVTLDKVDVMRGIAIDADDAAKFRIGGVFPNYTVVALVDIAINERIGVNYLVTGSEIVMEADTVVVPPIDPPPVTGWPDATNTGVPAGITLKSSGDIVVNTAGTVLDSLDIKGAVTINADNVTLKNSKVTTSAFNAVLIKQGVTGTVVDHCEVNGGGKTAGNNGINGTGTLTFNNVYGFENDINVAGKGPTLIQDNYLHGLKAPGSPHYDTIQIDGAVSNVTIRHNTIINDFGQTSAVMIDNFYGPISNIIVDNNLMVGGGYTIYVDGHFGGSEGGTGGPITGVSITNNHMGKGQYSYTNYNKTSPVSTGNVDYKTGKPVS